MFLRLVSREESMGIGHCRRRCLHCHSLHCGSRICCLHSIHRLCRIYCLRHSLRLRRICYLHGVHRLHNFRRRINIHAALRHIRIYVRLLIVLKTTGSVIIKFTHYFLLTFPCRRKSPHCNIAEYIPASKITQPPPYFPVFSRGRHENDTP